MLQWRKILLGFVVLFVFWILLFDFQRILFSIHNWDKFQEITFWEWFKAFYYSIRLDLAMAAILSLIPFLFWSTYLVWGNRWLKRTFIGVLLVETIIVSFIHAGEINAYPEWNHKLTSRVFMHLSNPDEVFRTADWSMTFWFIIYSILEMTAAWRLQKWLFKGAWGLNGRTMVKVAINGAMIAVFTILSLVLARGGWQQIPINIDAAYYSQSYVANDLSVNSTYFFAKSYLLYNRSEIDDFIPTISEETARERLSDFFDYPEKHNNYFLSTDKPNVVFILLESWTAKAVGSISGNETATPHFDQLSKDGILFTNFYATGGTSEIGNASIFSGYPALPEISISMQPDKHRKLPSINEQLEKWGYSTAYLFSGDLKYGNIGGYFKDHGFDKVEDENDFPKDLPRGKLNYYDQDLYDLLIDKMNASKEPFLQCGFTGSTHSPYDHPNKVKYTKYTGAEGAFMNSMLYADKCLADFIEKCKKEPWYENTLFVFVADHGHASSFVRNPSTSAYFHIPLLFYGEPLKEEYRGKRIDALFSQTDIARTLMYQLKGDYEKFEWSKDMMNPNAPQFALHTINRGFGWVTPSGNFTYYKDGEKYIDKAIDENTLEEERKRCEALMSLVYEQYKKL